jgi:hypothetical protein
MRNLAGKFMNFDLAILNGDYQRSFQKQCRSRNGTLRPKATNRGRKAFSDGSLEEELQRKSQHMIEGNCTPLASKGYACFEWTSMGISHPSVTSEAK